MLNQKTTMWVCSEKGVTVILVQDKEEGGFTVYDASGFRKKWGDVERFRPEDGVPMWRTLDEKALECGWHKWKYNSILEHGLKWALWSESERDFQTTITWWEYGSRGGIYTSATTCGSGAGNTRKRSGASGGSGAQKKRTRVSWGVESWHGWGGKRTKTRGAGKQNNARQRASWVQRW